MQCRRCGTERPESEFYVHSDARLRTECKTCTIERQRVKTLGIDNQQYAQMLVNQGGVCAICRCALNTSRYTKLAVDHDHKTHRVRGLLCTACNTGLGLFKDSPERLRAAVEYLSRFSDDIVRASGQPEEDAG